MLIADKLMSQSNSKTHPTTALQSPHWQTLSLPKAPLEKQPMDQSNMNTHPKVLMWVPMQTHQFNYPIVKSHWKKHPMDPTLPLPISIAFQKHLCLSPHILYGMRGGPHVVKLGSSCPCWISSSFLGS